MKKIITAIGNPEINKELQKEKTIQIIGMDIQYQEGIIETLETNPLIDSIILNSILSGNYLIEELIQKIQKANKEIQIILLLKKEQQDKINIPKQNNIILIFYDNEIKYSDIIPYLELKSQDKNEEIKQEIHQLKEIILQKKRKTILERIKMNYKTQEEKITAKTICILGTKEIGKTIFTINIANILKETYQKIIVIDANTFSNDIHTIWGINKKDNKLKNKWEDYIVPINNKIDIISDLNFLKEENQKINYIKTDKWMKEIKEKYEIILIDTSSLWYWDTTKIFLSYSDSNVFLLQANLIEIKKAKELLTFYNEQWQEEKEKIKIVINKYDSNSIDLKLMKEIFGEYKIIGKIKFNSYYNLYINKNIKDKNIQREIEKEYKEIFLQITKQERKTIETFKQNIYKKIKEEIKKYGINSHAE